MSIGFVSSCWHGPFLAHLCVAHLDSLDYSAKAPEPPQTLLDMSPLSSACPTAPRMPHSRPALLS